MPQYLPFILILRLLCSQMLAQGSQGQVSHLLALPGLIQVFFELSSLEKGGKEACCGWTLAPVPALTKAALP